MHFTSTTRIQNNSDLYKSKFTSTYVFRNFVERSENIEENVFSALFTVKNDIDLQYTKRPAQIKIPNFLNM